MSCHRVVITGSGAVSPLGNSSVEMWRGLLEGRSGIGRIAAFDAGKFACGLAGEAKDFKVRDLVPKNCRKMTKLMSRDIELAVGAAHEAILSSGIVTKGIDEAGVNIDPRRFGINIGAGLISCDLEEISPAAKAAIVDGEFDLKKWGERGLDLVTPLWLLKYLPNMPACHIGIIHDLQGPSNTITCAEVSAFLSIAEGAEYITRGWCEAVVAGGTEGKVNPIVMMRQCLLGRSATGFGDEPEKACRPFDAKASGSVFGEGAGMIVLEDMERAKGRGAKILAEVLGTGESNNLSDDFTHLEADGAGLRIAIENAMADAGVEAADIDLVIPHGLGIAADDAAEARAIISALGAAGKRAAVFPTKSMLSCTGAAAGAMDVIAGAMAISEGVIPAAKNFEKAADGCELNINTKKIAKEIGRVLVCGYTYAGQTAAIVLGKV